MRGSMNLIIGRYFLHVGSFGTIARSLEAEYVMGFEWKYNDYNLVTSCIQRTTRTYAFGRHTTNTRPTQKEALGLNFSPTEH